MEWFLIETASLLLLLGFFYTTQLLCMASFAVIRLAVRRVRVLLRL